MKRKLYDKLLEWKNDKHRKPLVLNGVRQCGKTYLLKEFGKSEFQSLAYITCDCNQELSRLFEADFEVNRIIRGISALSGVDIMPGKTLIFLDEVRRSQECWNP